MTNETLRAALEEIIACCVAPKTSIMTCWIIAKDALAADAEQAKLCPYCNNDNEGVKATFYDATCAGCNYRMTGRTTPQPQPAIPAAPEQAEPVAWIYRHLDTANTPNKWSEWELCKPRNPNTGTAADYAEEIQGYIDMGYRYELLPVYTTPQPQPAIPAAPEQPTDLHNAIMNLPCPSAYAQTEEAMALRKEYIAGFRDARHAAAELVAQQATPEQATPGWKLVPIEPTGDMIRAADALPDVFSIGDEYRAMLEAAPYAAPSPQQRDESKDAARWKYLRENCEVRIRDLFYSCAQDFNEGLDAAIDAAIAQERTS